MLGIKTARTLTLKGAVLGDKEQGVGIRDQGSGIRDKGLGIRD